MNPQIESNPPSEPLVPVIEPAQCPQTKPGPKRKSPPPRLRELQSAGRGGGWMWMEKDALDRILLKTSKVEAGLILSTYAALCRLSSDRGNATSVTAGMALIEKLAGCSRRTVIRAIAELERVKLIAVRRVRRGNRNDENTYALLAVGKVRTSQTPVSDADQGSDYVASGVSHNGQVSGAELKTKTHLAAAATADAQQPPECLIDTNKGSRVVRGLGCW